jgi:hypothetical protein
VKLTEVGLTVGDGGGGASGIVSETGILRSVGPLNTIMSWYIPDARPVGSAETTSVAGVVSEAGDWMVIHFGWLLIRNALGGVLVTLTCWDGMAVPSAGSVKSSEAGVAVKVRGDSV